MIAAKAVPWSKAMVKSQQSKRITFEGKDTFVVGENYDSGFYNF
jgi:hypothetical protein